MVQDHPVQRAGWDRGNESARLLAHSEPIRAGPVSIIACAELAGSSGGGARPRLPVSGASQLYDPSSVGLDLRCRSSGGQSMKRGDSVKTSGDDAAHVEASRGNPERGVTRGLLPFDRRWFEYY